MTKNGQNASVRAAESSVSRIGSIPPKSPATIEATSIVRGKRSMKGTVIIHHAIDSRNHVYQNGLRKS